MWQINYYFVRNTFKQRMFEKYFFQHLYDFFSIRVVTRKKIISFTFILIKINQLPRDWSSYSFRSVFISSERAIQLKINKIYNFHEKEL